MTKLTPEPRYDKVYWEFVDRMVAEESIFPLVNRGQDAELTMEIRRGQTRRHSAIESMANVAVGFGVALLTQIIVFPLFGIETNLSDNIGIGLIFTVVSLVRSYSLRRVFRGSTDSAQAWTTRGREYGCYSESAVY